MRIYHFRNFCHEDRYPFPLLNIFAALHLYDLSYCTHFSKQNPLNKWNSVLLCKSTSSFITVTNTQCHPHPLPQKTATLIFDVIFSCVLKSLRACVFAYLSERLKNKLWRYFVTSTSESHHRTSLVVVK